MHIITTIYCADLKLNQRNAQDPEKQVAPSSAKSGSDDVFREFLTAYQGENRTGSTGSAS
jgi:hypothetical protein